MCCSFICIHFSRSTVVHLIESINYKLSVQIHIFIFTDQSIEIWSQLCFLFLLENILVGTLSLWRYLYLVRALIVCNNLTYFAVFLEGSKARDSSNGVQGTNFLFYFNLWLDLANHYYHYQSSWFEGFVRRWGNLI